MSDVGASESEAVLCEPKSEQSERTAREGLERRNERLNIGQNIGRVYQCTPELQWLGEAIVSKDVNKIKESIKRAVEAMGKYYNLHLIIKPDSEMVKITKNSGNKATLRGRDIYMCSSLENDPLTQAIELAHELGAARLISIYGSKDNIPNGLPDPTGRYETRGATHFLDRFIRSGGKNMSNIDSNRKFCWENGKLITRQ